MEISGNNLNQPVSFYNKNTGNSINMAINEDNNVYGQNLFAPELSLRENSKNVTSPAKKRRKSKRLNTIDSDYLPDETTKEAQKTGNFFLEPEKPNIFSKLKKSFSHFVSVTPLINYFFLKEKTKKIQKTVASLNDISQNVDDLMSTTVPYGEETALYSDIAKNLTNAAEIINKANKEL